MEVREILIKIRAEFQKAAVDKAEKALTDLEKKANKASKGTQGFSGSLDRAVKSLTRFHSGVKKANTGFGGFTSSVSKALMTVTGFNTIFGRVTMGMLTWQAWRTVANGFREIGDATFGANMRMQSATQMFTALSGGSEEMAGRYIEIVRTLANETGTSFDELMNNARRLPTQVGRNFEAFGELTKKAIVLGMIDPQQGVEGAMFAITNFLEGTAAGARSLIQRFEMFSRPQVKNALEKAGDPVEALEILFEEANIDVDLMIEKLQNSLPVALEASKNMLKEFLRVMSEPAIAMFTEDIVKIRDFFRDNQPAVQGLAEAVGEGLTEGYGRARNLLTDLLGIQDEFDPMAWFDAGVEIMVSFADGIFSAMTDYILPAITQVAGLIAGFFIGASPPPLGPLSKIKEGGQETIKQYVLGLVEGLNSQAISGMAQGIIDNIIDLEAQQLNQEKSVKQMEKWVDEASKALRDKRDELKLFDLETEDIPERYTRGRRRQLELEILNLEKQERSRKEAVAAAKEQLKATKEFLQVQRRILSTLQQQQRAREAAEKKAAKELEKGKLLDKGFLESDIVGPAEEVVAKWKAIFSEKLQPLFAEFREGFGDLADFFRGLVGADPDAARGITEMYEMGQNLAESVTTIATAFEKAGSSVVSLLTSANETWSGLDPNLKKLIMSILAAVLVPKLALTAGITLVLSDPSNIKGWVLGVFGLAATGAAIPIVKTFIRVFSLIFKVGGPAGIAMGKLIAATTTGLLGGGAATASALVLPITLLLGLLMWKGKDVLKTGFQLAVVLDIMALTGIDWVKEQLAKVGINIFPETDFGETINEIATGAIKVDEQIAGLKQPWEYLWQDVLPGIISGAKGDVESATLEGLFSPVVDVGEKLDEEMVGRSIIPDMMTSIVREFRELPSRLVAPLRMLDQLITVSMESISRRWIMSWQMMVRTTVQSMTIMVQQYAGMNKMLAQMEQTRRQYDSYNTQYAQAAAAAAGDGAGNRSIELNLDANETNRLMREGVYAGMLDVMGRS